MPKRHSTKSKGRPWWAAQVAAYEKSGLTLKAFSESRGLNASTFGKWLFFHLATNLLPALIVD